jgi:hypothetical protein
MYDLITTWVPVITSGKLVRWCDDISWTSRPLSVKMGETAVVDECACGGVERGKSRAWSLNNMASTT